MWFVSNYTAKVNQQVEQHGVLVRLGLRFDETDEIPNASREGIVRDWIRPFHSSLLLAVVMWERSLVTKELTTNYLVF
jgi:hypothetical protein